MGSGSRFSDLTPSLAQASRYVLWLLASGLSNPGHKPPRIGRYPQERTISSSCSTPVLYLFQALTTSSFSSPNPAMHTKSCFLLICYPMFWAFHSGDFSRHGRKQKNPCFCVPVFWSLTPRHRLALQTIFPFWTHVSLWFLWQHSLSSFFLLFKKDFTICAPC